MSTCAAKCDICGTENTVASYGDWSCSQCGQGYTYDECHQIRLTDAQLAMLRNLPRWIPVSELLPEDGQSVIVFWSKYREVGEAVFGKKEGFFSTDRGGCYDVSHWMPLPEPPEVKR